MKSTKIPLMEAMVYEAKCETIVEITKINAIFDAPVNLV